MTPVINVVIEDNDFGIKGCAHENRDGSYTIFINAKLSAEKQKEVYKHELFHIVHGDFEQDNVESIERLAHKIAN